MPVRPGLLPVRPRARRQSSVNSRQSSVVGRRSSSVVVGRPSSIVVGRPSSSVVVAVAVVVVARPSLLPPTPSPSTSVLLPPPSSLVPPSATHCLLQCSAPSQLVSHLIVVKSPFLFLPFSLTHSLTHSLHCVTVIAAAAMIAGILGEYFTGLDENWNFVQVNGPHTTLRLSRSSVSGRGTTHSSRSRKGSPLYCYATMVFTVFSNG